LIVPKVPRVACYDRQQRTVLQHTNTYNVITQSLQQLHATNSSRGRLLKRPHTLRARNDGLPTLAPITNPNPEHHISTHRLIAVVILALRLIRTQSSTITGTDASAVTVTESRLVLPQARLLSPTLLQSIPTRRGRSHFRRRSGHAQRWDKAAGCHSSLLRSLTAPACKR